jgi:uncharacterized protein
MRRGLGRISVRMSRLALPRPTGAHRLAANLTKLLGVLLALWVIGSAAAEVTMLHPRHWGIGPTPAAQGIAYRDVAFKNSDRMTLRGWWMPGTRHQTLVMIHGWTSSRREPMSKAGYLAAAGYNLLVFDLRGHGASDGSYTTMGFKETDDVRAAIALAQGLDPGAPIALFGYSMGGALAVEEASRNPAVAAVVEDSAFSALSDVFSADFSHLFGVPAMPFGLAYVAIAQHDLGLDINSVRPVADAAHLTKPLLAILGTADKMVPPAEGYAIFNAALGPKQLLVVPGAGHTQEYFVEPDTYKATVLAFLAKSFAGPKVTASAGL